MKHELPPLPTRPLPMFKDPTGGIYLYDGLTMDKQAFAYAKQCIEPLQARIAELEAQLAGAYALLETAKAVQIANQVKALRAQITNNQESTNA
jgi:hypothetical protein